MKKILVTTDGSEHSKKALLEARQLAEYSGAEVVIMHVMKEVVINPYGTMEHSNLFSKSTTDQGNFAEKAFHDAQKMAENLLEDSLALFSDFPREVKTILIRGDAGDEIIREAEKGDYDLVVMGSRGLGTFSRAMLGSISNKVLNHVDVNVLIVK